MLRELAERHRVRVTGDERAGSFAAGDVEGEYEFGEDGLRGRFASRRVKGEFSIKMGKATVTVIERPFWLLEALLRRKIAEGMDAFLNELASCRAR